MDLYRHRITGKLAEYATKKYKENALEELNKIN